MSLPIRKKSVKRFIKLFLVAATIVLVYTFIEKSVMPTLIAVSEGEAKKIANSVIDNSVRTSVTDMDIKTEDFFVYLNDGKQITANTILINKLCSDVSSNINELFLEHKEKRIYVAIGALSGINMLFNTGPKANFKIRQVGETNVDYETSFSSAGINQTNYKVWINVELEVILIHPLKSKTLVSERKVMLIDTVIEGKVPDRYLSFD